MALTKDGYEMTTAETHREIKRLRKENAKLRKENAKLQEWFREAQEERKNEP